jgi:hypothetical protein
MNAANDNDAAVYAGFNAGGGYTVYDYRKGYPDALDFYTEQQARDYVFRTNYEATEKRA